MRKAHENSLAGQVRFFSRLIVIILLIPTVISLVVTAAYAVSFHRSVSMMGNVAALRPVVEEIPERLWSVIAGRESFEESGVDDAILQVDRSLDSFLSQMGENKGTRITVARRTMDTLAAYSDRIEQEMADEKVPVTASEKTLEEVRSVAALIGDMLEAFIEDEALEVYRKNVSFQRSIFLVVGISLFLLLSALIVSGWAARRQTETMEGSIRQLELLTLTINQPAFSYFVGIADFMHISNRPYGLSFKLIKEERHFDVCFQRKVLWDMTRLAD